MKTPALLMLLLAVASLLTSCALTKVVTVPVKATCTVVGGTADIID